METGSRGKGQGKTVQRQKGKSIMYKDEMAPYRVVWVSGCMGVWVGIGVRVRVGGRGWMLGARVPY